MHIPAEKKEKVKEALVTARDMVEETLGRGGDTKGRIANCIVIAELVKQLLK